MGAWVVVDQFKDCIQRRHAIGSELGGVGVKMYSVNGCGASLLNRTLKSGSAFFMAVQLNFSVASLSRDQVDGHGIRIVARSRTGGGYQPSRQSAQLTFPPKVSTGGLQACGNTRARYRCVLVCVYHRGCK